MAVYREWAQADNNQRGVEKCDSIGSGLESLGLARELIEAGSELGRREDRRDLCGNQHNASDEGTEGNHLDGRRDCRSV